MMRASLVLLLALTLPAATARAESPAVLFVLDASGSMMAKIQGKTKIDIARAVMTDLVKSIEPGVQVGLMAYGHHRKADCKDIEVVVPLGDDRTAITRAVQALPAKGETPITDAVRMAAQELASHEGPASVVVVSDGKETCGGDPCAATREAVAAGVHLRIHVVGFDVTPEEAKQLQCVAREGKGRYFAASNATELSKALAEVKKEVAPTPAPAPTTAPAPRPTATQPAAKTGLRLHAVLAAGKPAIDKDLAWDVLVGAADIEGQEKKVAYSYDAQPFFELAPGKYRVRVKRGDTTREFEYEVRDGDASDREVVLDAGRVKATARLAADSPPIDKDVAWDVLVGRGAESERENIAVSYDATPIFTLPAGHYVLAVKRGSAGGEKELDVVAGEEQSLELVIGAGRLKMTALFSPGGEAISRDLIWDVLDGKQSLEEKGRHIVTSYDASPVFTLGAGKYVVVCKRGQAEAEMPVEIHAGEDQRHEIVLNAGLLQVHAVGSAGGSAFATELTWDVLAGAAGLEGDRKHFVTSYDATPTFTLTAGKYHVEAKHGLLHGAADVEVKAGEKAAAEVVVDQPN